MVGRQQQLAVICVPTLIRLGASTVRQHVWGRTCTSCPGYCALELAGLLVCCRSCRDALQRTTVAARCV